MDNYVNINALDVEFKSANRPAYSFEDWAKLNDLYFIVEELDAMDGNLHLGTHRVNMYKDEYWLEKGYGDGILESFISLIRSCTGREWFLTADEVQVKAPMKFKGIK